MSMLELRVGDLERRVGKLALENDTLKRARNLDAKSEKAFHRNNLDFILNIIL
jgi:hypothetical protein